MGHATSLSRQRSGARKALCASKLARLQARSDMKRKLCFSILCGIFDARYRINFLHEIEKRLSVFDHRPSR